MRKNNRTDSSVENIGRRMMSRRKKNQVRILHSLMPGMHTGNWLGCCNAPTCCPMCSLCPCCNESEYIALKRQSSKYVFIRENSIEWNEPEIVMRQGNCCIDPCVYEIHDKINVLYFDDPIFNRITDQTRVCNECRTYLCGGRGERIQIDSVCCFNLCHRSALPCPFVPICCPVTLFPCMLKYEVYVDDAQRGMYEIKEARKAAMENSLYSDYNIENVNDTIAANSSGATEEAKIENVELMECS
jgi:hypothetical protein